MSKFDVALHPGILGNLELHVSLRLVHIYRLRSASQVIINFQLTSIHYPEILNFKLDVSIER